MQIGGGAVLGVPEEKINPYVFFENTLEDFANAIIKVCGYYGIPVCDMFHNCTMNPSIPAQKTLYFQDDTHPNPLGQRRMGNLVTGFVGTLV